MIAAQALGLWHTTDIKETVYLFFGTGVLLVGRAIKSASNSNWPRMILCPALRLTLIVEFLVNLYVFPFGVEMVFVRFVVLAAFVEAVAALDPAHAPGRDSAAASSRRSASACSPMFSSASSATSTDFSREKTQKISSLPRH